MPRPSKCRRICKEPISSQFGPMNANTKEEVVLQLDEYEVMRLLDLEGFTQEECAKQLEVARTTVTDIYTRARRKITDCIVNGKQLIISGGSYRFCAGDSNVCPKKCCHRAKKIVVGMPKAKGAFEMRIAVTYENEMIFQHFGHTQQFKVYDIQDGSIVSSEVIDTNGQGHGALSGLLNGLHIDVLICGGIGAGAQNALAACGIELLGGVSGKADDAVKAYITGNLVYDANVQCNHHGHGEHNCHNHETHECHGHGTHTCGHHHE